MSLDVFRVIVELLLLLLMLYMAFFKSYMKQKGKNLATKEDMHEITETVEGIKAELSVGAASRISLQVEERTSVIDFYMKYNAWLSLVTGNALFNVRPENREEFQEIENRIELSYNEFRLAEGRMELFVDNKNIQGISYELAKATRQYYGMNLQTVGKIQLVFLEIDQMKALTPLDKQLALFQTLLEKQKALITDAMAQGTEHYKAIFSLKWHLRKELYDHITKLYAA